MWAHVSDAMRTFTGGSGTPKVVPAAVHASRAVHAMQEGALPHASSTTLGQLHSSPPSHTLLPPPDTSFPINTQSITTIHSQPSHPPFSPIPHSSNTLLPSQNASFIDTKTSSTLPLPPSSSNTLLPLRYASAPIDTLASHMLAMLLSHAQQVGPSSRMLVSAA